MGEVTPNGAVILDTKNEMAWFRFMTGYRALHLEARTGMKVARGFSAVKFFGEYGFKSKKLKPLMEEVKAYLEEQSAAGEIPKEVFAALRNDMGMGL